jgi:DNA-binding transcriptional regulator YdaS (Cro superfamily)
MEVDLKKIIVDAGGYSKVAKKLGTTKQVVWSWANVLGKIPSKWAIRFSDIVGIPESELRPDVYRQPTEH